MLLTFSSAFISKCILILCILTMTASINIVHWNCQGFNAHGPEYIWSLSKQKQIPDIICLQETFFQNEKDHPDITGFSLTNFLTRNSKRGGTDIYCKNHINYTMRNTDTLLEVSVIDIKLNNKLTTIINMYMIQIVNLHKMIIKKNIHLH